MQSYFRISAIWHIAPLFCLLLVIASASNAELTIHKNKASGLLTWGSVENGFSIELIQLSPDFVRAIYAKHAFPKNELERIAGLYPLGKEENDPK